MPKVKPRKCKICRCPALSQSIEPVCSLACGVELARRKREKLAAKAGVEKRREIKVRKDKIKGRSEWLAEVQEVFNRYIRLRDQANGDGCISCCTTKPNIQYCAGHFYTRKARPDLRFNKDNVHLQCNFHCNQNLSGNIEKYRPNLIAKIGLERFESLAVVGRSDWDIEELKAMKQEFKAKIKELG